MEECGTGAGCRATTEILARRGRLRRMLGGSQRKAAACCGRGSGVAGGGRLGSGGTPWWGDERGDPGGFAEAEQICPQATREENRRAGDCSERGYGVTGVRTGRRFQSATR